MNKHLKFSPQLVPLILSGQKVSTWRLFDDKELSVGDIVNFLEHGTGRHFASGRLIRVVEKLMGELTDTDKEGHEKFETDEEMYATYSRYYGKSISEATPVKLIWFELRS